MKKIVLLPILLATLTLASCNPTPSISESETPSSSASLVTSSATESSETESSVLSSEDVTPEEAMLLAAGYDKHLTWPEATVNGFLVDGGVSETLPPLISNQVMFTDNYFDLLMGLDAFEIAVLDTTSATLVSVQSILVTAGWEEFSDLEDEIYIQVYSPLYEIFVYGELYEGDEVYPEATYLYIYSLAEEEVVSPLEDMDKHQSWPTAYINGFLADMGANGTLPPLPNVTEVYTIEDEDEFGEYIFMAIPTSESRTVEYKGILEAAGFEVDEDEEYDYYFGLHPQTEIAVEFFFDLADDFGYPDGMYFYIWY